MLNKSKKTVAVIYGGEGAEHDISVKSAESLLDFIDTELYSPLPVKIERDGCWYIVQGESKIPTYPALIDGVGSLKCETDALQIHAAIICLHGDFGEDGVIQGALCAAHIPYIGQDTHAAAMTADKAFTKLAAERLGIPTAKWHLSVNETAEEAKKAARGIGYPVFIKPARLGSSIGAYPVLCEAELDGAYEKCAALSSGRILMEQRIDVSFELECAYLNDGEARFSPYGQILTDGSFYDFSTKYIAASDSCRTSAAFDGSCNKIYSEAIRYSRLLVEFLGIRQLARIDFFVTREGVLVFNEINTIPGMTKTSLYPILTEQMGLGRGEFINRLLGRICK